MFFGIQYFVLKTVNILLDFNKGIYRSIDNQLRPLFFFKFHVELENVSLRNQTW